MPKKIVVEYTAMGKRIRKYREEIGITQGDLAYKVGLSNTTISHIECGAGRPELNSLVMIANALGVTVDMLLCESIEASGRQYKCELADFLNSCSASEVRLLCSIVPEIIEAYRRDIPRSHGQMQND